MDNKKVNVGIIGLGFGKEFIPIYQKHPNGGKIAICTRRRSELDRIGDMNEIDPSWRYTDYREMIQNEELDAIHVVTPVMDHYPMVMAALKANKHAACTIPMATTIQQCKDIVAATQESGKVYMMMETSLYTREYLYVKAMKEQGKLGEIQFVRSDHMQNMALPGWPDYWQGFPPFLNGTHALSPAVCLVGKRPTSVVAHGSGVLSEARTKNHDCPFPVITATFKFEDSNVIVESTRWINETIRQCREGFDVYGTDASFEWELIIDDGHVIFTGIDDAEKIECPDTDNLLPDEIAEFTRREAVVDTTHTSFRQGVGHGGSHPHLVHQFLKAIVNGTKAEVNEVVAATITAAGICAQESAMNGSKRIEIPDFGY
ncbi:MAG TPA: oxidoreductase [Firmicutes bacterium]|nr:oxidoreductase [Bacillota bacterium]